MAEYDYNAADTWMCRCGKTSTGKFCVKCGTGNSRRSFDKLGCGVEGRTGKGSSGNSRKNSR